ncbi:MAG TPA: alpha/beta hydrolase [Rhodocyclaceae bacterium]|nr:alpha/beta hydrolase [Rhodocyclaceae bacterium]
MTNPISRAAVFALGACLITAGCVTVPTAQERRATADTQASARSWDSTTLHAGAFDLAAWLPRRIVHDEVLTIYIEGDGLAWLSSDMPSADPTPVTPVGLQLALAQPTGNVAYLARPCQYVTSDRCERRYWTNERFAPEIVAAENQAVDTLKRRFGAAKLTLVGYSGGAAVAALLAERRRDVVRLITVAGNLDHRAWTTHHRVTPLTGSLNPVDGKVGLATIPQWHFVGERDKIVPPFLAQEFSVGMPSAHVTVVEGYDHKCCWSENWKNLWKDIR